MKKLHAASYLVSGYVAAGKGFPTMASEAIDEFMHEEVEPGEVFNASNGLCVVASILHEDDIELGAMQ